MTTALKRNLVLFTLVGLMFVGCKKKEEQNVLPPRLGTPFTFVSGGKVILSTSVDSKVTSSNSSKVGFIIGKEQDINLDKYIEKAIVDSGNFQIGDGFTKTFFDLDLNDKYYAKAFSINSEGKTRISDAVAFNTGCIDVDSITPRIGEANTNITIYGKKFGTDNAEIFVKFSKGNKESQGIVTFLSNNIINVNFNNNSFSIGDTVSVLVSSSLCHKSVSAFDKGKFIYK